MLTKYYLYLKTKSTFFVKNAKLIYCSSNMQEAVFKPATEGLDIIGRARTGTGKTMAFGIPIIQSLLKHNKQNRTR